MIKGAAEESFPGDGRLARAAGIYLCHRFSGVKLQDIGDLYGISIFEGPRRTGGSKRS